ncbi:hypothetical protein CR513_19626, partial [Mucuna pruriens]
MDSIWVLVVWLTKSTHFIPFNVRYSLEKLTGLYISEISSPITIVTILGMIPYETLYEQRCRTPLCWFELGESLVLGPEVVQQTIEKIKLI